MEQASGSDAGFLPDRIYSIQYKGNNKAAIASYYDDNDRYTLVYINPYSGEVLKTKLLNRDFFRIMFTGHFYLWLPPHIGQPVVAWSILIFVILLFTGLIMWWPKNLKKANTGKSFRIKWRAGFKRLNYDLHNVLGFYAMLVALVLALTGLVWGFEWFGKSYYSLISGGKPLTVRPELTSDTTAAALSKAWAPEDKIWQRMSQEYSWDQASVTVLFPQKNADPFVFQYNPGRGTHYKREFRYFDRYTLQELEGGSLYETKYEEAPLGDKVYRMNYDIHVGAILGLPGKILAFFASLICASLPVTGFLIWWSRRKKKLVSGNKRAGREDTRTNGPVQGRLPSGPPQEQAGSSETYTEKTTDTAR